jgi:hypothetical protein
MYCTNCGAENPDKANFCGQCGTPLSRVGDATTGALHLSQTGAPEHVDVGASPADDLGIAVAELEPGTALLAVVRGPNDGARFLLDRDVTTVGRHPDSDIFLDDITVSRRHAEFRRHDGGFWIHDSGSLNGTYVNGTRAEEQRLSPRDEVQIGKFRFVVLLAEQAT